MAEVGNYKGLLIAPGYLLMCEISARPGTDGHNSFGSHPGVHHEDRQSRPIIIHVPYNSLSPAPPPTNQAITHM